MLAPTSIEDGEPLVSSQGDGDSGTSDPGQPAQDHHRTANHRRGVAGAHDGIGVALADHADRADDAVVALRAEGFDAVGAGDDVLGVNDGEPGLVRAAFFFQAATDGALPADQRHLEFGVAVEGPKRPADGLLRGMIPAHGVESDTHGYGFTRPG